MDNAIDIQLQAEGLALGDTMRGVCPECDSSAKFYITRMDDGGGLAYICHRARACGNRGYINGTGDPAATEQPKPKYIPYRGELRDPSPDETALLTERFPLLPRDGIAPHLVRIAEDHYWALRVQGPQYEHRGWVIRKPWWPSEVSNNDLPKSRTFRENGDGPMIAWYGRRDGTGGDTVGTVIVEDQMSAITVAQNTYFDAVALLGTTFNLPRAREIQKHGAGGGVVLALDADVVEHAFHIARGYAPAFDSFRVALLTKDIKDMTLPELNDTLGIAR